MFFTINSLRHPVLLLSLSALCNGKNANAPFPYAVTFGPSSIIASSVTKSGDIAVYKYNAGDSYKAYFNDAVAHYGEHVGPIFPYNQEDAVPIFRDAIKDIILNLKDAIGYEPTVAGLCMPSIFNASSKSAADTALFPDGFLTKDGPKIAKDVAGSASFAYRLDQCESLDLTPAECKDVDSLILLVLVVELEKQYLHLHLREVDTEWGVFTTIRNRHIGELGEQSGHDLREEIGTKEYIAKLSNAFHDFIEYALIPPYKREHATAIVLAGEASDSAFAEIKEIAYNAVDNGKVRVFDSIDPAVVAAHGAALYARQTVVRRDLWGYKDDQEEKHAHDEL